MNKRSGAATRERILDAAHAVFSSQGYNQASMRAIARAAGMSVGGLYIHFQDKEALHHTLMSRCLEDLTRKRHEALAQTADPVAALRGFITVTLAHARENRAMILLQGRELGVSFGSELKKSFSRESRQRLAGLICQGISAGAFRQVDAEEAGRVIFSALRGFVLSLVIDEEALFSAEECADLLLHGLRDSENTKIPFYIPASGHL